MSGTSLDELTTAVKFENGTFCCSAYAVVELLIMFERDIKLKAYAHGCCIQLLYHPVHLAQRRHFKIKVPFQVDAY